MASVPLQARLDGTEVLPGLCRLMAFNDVPNTQPFKCVPGVYATVSPACLQPEC